MTQLERKSSLRFVHTEGRPPWYDDTGNPRTPFIIGVCGGTASGKTTVCNAITAKLNVPWVVLLSQDSFYRPLTEEEAANVAEYNFDHPNAIDWELLIQTIKDLKEGKSVDIPVYDFTTHSRLAQTRKIYGADVIILEGILVFYPPDLRAQMDMKIFVDIDADIRLCRRLRRDIKERGRTAESVINQYNKFVKPAFEDFIQPTMQYADIIAPRGAANIVAITLIADNISKKLQERGLGANIWETSPLTTIPSNVHVEVNPQMHAMLTILRNRDTALGDFVFYSDRITRLLLEKALSYLPWVETEIETPTEAKYPGVTLRQELLAVSIMRGGGCMEAPLMQIYKGIRIGKLLIQSDKKKNPRLFYLDLPAFTKDSHVLLLEPTLATGATVKMAIRTLLDHGVQEQNIILVSVIAATHGLHSVCFTFPKVTVVVSAVDQELNEFGYIVPGIGNYGDRYFGTA